MAVLSWKMCENAFSDNLLQKDLNPLFFCVFSIPSPPLPLINVGNWLKFTSRVRHTFWHHTRIFQHWHGGKGGKNSFFYEGVQPFCNWLSEIWIKIGILLLIVPVDKILWYLINSLRERQCFRKWWKICVRLIDCDVMTSHFSAKKSTFCDNFWPFLALFFGHVRKTRFFYNLFKNIYLCS